MFQRLAEQPFGVGRGQVVRVHPGRTQPLGLPSQRVALAVEMGPAGVVDQAQLATKFGQPLVGVVLAQLQPEFGAAGEHPVGLRHALGDQVVHQHAQVRLVAPKHEAVGAFAGAQRRVHAREQALRCRFFVAGRAVDLAGEEQAADRTRLERALEFARIEVVVFDRVARAQDVRVGQAGHRTHRRQLDVERQRRRDAVGIELVCRQSLGLQEDLVRVLVGEAVDLVLDARAVARPHPLDDAREHRAAIETGADDLVRARVRVRHPARHLARVLGGRAHETEHGHRRRDLAVGVRHAVAGLLSELREVDRAPVDARRRARLQATLRQLQLLQARGQTLCRRIARAPGAVVLQTHVDLAIQERPGRQHDGTAPERDARLRDGRGDAVDAVHRLDDEVVHRLLEQPQVGLVLEPVSDGRLVEDAIRLRTRRPHGRPFRTVQDAELDARLVRRRRHRAAERVHFLHEVPLADAADRRIAAHLPERLDVVRQQQRRAAHASGRERSLGSGMAAADHDDVEFLGVDHR